MRSSCYKTQGINGSLLLQAPSIPTCLTARSSDARKHLIISTSVVSLLLGKQHNQVTHEDWWENISEVSFPASPSSPVLSQVSCRGTGDLLGSLKFALASSLLKIDHADLRSISQRKSKARLGSPVWLGRSQPQQRARSAGFPAASLGVPRVTGAQYALLFQSKAFA